MMTPPKRERGVCGGEGCGLENVWPLHNVRQRGVFQRLCTSCVLRYHPGSFCTVCFDFLDGSQSPSSVIHCSSCPSLSHTTCLLLPSDPYDSSHKTKHLCPTCACPNDFSYFSLSSYAKRPTPPLDDHPNQNENILAANRKEGCNTIDLESAKVLLVAARIATVSMNRALSGYRMEAERKVKESLVAKRRATEMLERAIFVAKKNREKKMKVNTTTHDGNNNVEMSDPGKKVRGFKSSANASLVAAQKRIQSREREKLMKFQEPIALAKVAAAAAAVGSFSVSDGGLPNNVVPHKSTAEDEKEKNGTFLASHTNLVAIEEKKGVVIGPSRAIANIPTQTLTSPSKGDGRYFWQLCRYTVLQILRCVICSFQGMES